MSIDEAGDGVVRGWDSTPTEEPLPPTATNRQANCLPTPIQKGWRRTALYAIIVFLMILVFLNIALTLWIITSLKLSMNKIGPIQIVKGGIQVEGQAYMTGTLVASTISSRAAAPITLHAHRNFTILVSEPNQLESAKLLIKKDSIECSGKVFDVRNSRGESVFHASHDEVRLAAEALVVDGPGGVTVNSAIQTPFLRAPPGSDLQLESLTRSLDLRAPQSILLESRAGSIDITSHGHIKLNSLVGAIKIDAPNIIISNLKEAPVTDQPNKNLNIGKIKVYQLCACATGKIFLAAPHAACEANDSDMELCR